MREACQVASRSFSVVAAALLERAGGSLSVAEAAVILGNSTEELHRQVDDGEVLGVHLDDRLIIPRLQFNKDKVLPGIEVVIRTFREGKAGNWMVLQFLADQDPNLAKKPIDALRDGRLAAVEHAARAHLHLDEC